MLIPRKMKCSVGVFEQEKKVHFKIREAFLLEESIEYVNRHRYGGSLNPTTL